MGPCRFLTAPEVRRASDALSRVNLEALHHRFHPARMTRARIYPGAWERADLEYLLGALKRLRGYFAKAAAHGEAMLVYRI